MLRGKCFACAVAVVLAGFVPATAFAEADDEEAGDEPTPPQAGTPEASGEAPIIEEEDAGTAPESGSGSKKLTPKERRRAAAKAVWDKYKPRRKGKVTGRLVPDKELRLDPAPAPSGKVHVYSLAMHDEVEVNIFNDDGSYNLESLRKLNHVLRCKRTDTEKRMEPRLLVALSHLYDHFGKRIDIVSAYRNQRKETSYHFKGSAADVRIDGVHPKQIRAFAESLDAGGMGIGIYPKSMFVHVDVRPPPSFRWVDQSRANPNAAEKRPPKGWRKRKKLQS
jgi:uncharacterized protein YcbK (DUF882 family)